jgi:hypothetical protein
MPTVAIASSKLPISRASHGSQLKPNKTCKSSALTEQHGLALCLQADGMARGAILVSCLSPGIWEAATLARRSGLGSLATLATVQATMVGMGGWGSCITKRRAITSRTFFEEQFHSLTNMLAPGNTPRSHLSYWVPLILVAIVFGIAAGWRISLPGLYMDAVDPDYLVVRILN